MGGSGRVLSSLFEQIDIKFYKKNTTYICHHLQYSRVVLFLHIIHHRVLTHICQVHDKFIGGGGVAERLDSLALRKYNL